MTIEELHAERSLLVEERNAVTTSLTSLKARQGTMSATDYNQTRARLVAQDTQLSQRITALNQQIRETHRINNPSDKTKPAVTPGALRPIITDLSDLRDYYQSLAADRSRLRSVRDMSAEFAEKLTTINGAVALTETIDSLLPKILKLARHRLQATMPNPRPWSVEGETLATLKRELANYNIKTGKWKNR